MKIILVCNRVSLGMKSLFKVTEKGISIQQTTHRYQNFKSRFVLGLDEISYLCLNTEMVSSLYHEGWYSFCWATKGFEQDPPNPDWVVCCRNPFWYDSLFFRRTKYLASRNSHIRWRNWVRILIIILKIKFKIFIKINNLFNFFITWL
jgi:hypothetical protein